jgi:hypothetical protein
MIRNPPQHLILVPIGTRCTGSGVAEKEVEKILPIRPAPCRGVSGLPDFSTIVRCGIVSKFLEARFLIWGSTSQSTARPPAETSESREETKNGGWSKSLSVSIGPDREESSPNK